MSIRIVRLGSRRTKNEGLRIGTVRRPPRGVPRSEIASRDLYDIWLPELAPSEALLREARAFITDDAGWRRFERAYRKELKSPAARHLLGLLASMSEQTNFAVGCYCENESRCHRSILRALLLEHGATIE